ncbi:unnamed protein product [Arabidopsis lyrata]|nr:unnamed protein product [Arabidopsis lyrata]
MIKIESLCVGSPRPKLSKIASISVRTKALMFVAYSAVTSLKKIGVEGHQLMNSLIG